MFRSQTDTEAVVHLLEDEMTRTPEGPQQLTQALMSVFRQIHGLSAIAVVDGQTGKLAAAKNGSPLVIGWTDDGCYLASDPVALLAHTRRLVFVEDGQAASLDCAGPQVFDIETGRTIELDVRMATWEAHDGGLGRFHHYMEKEINEQPRVLRQLAGTKSADVAALAEAMRDAPKGVHYWLWDRQSRGNGGPVPILNDRRSGRHSGIGLGNGPGCSRTRTGLVGDSVIAEW